MIIFNGISFLAHYWYFLNMAETNRRNKKGRNLSSVLYGYFLTLLKVNALKFSEGIHQFFFLFSLSIPVYIQSEITFTIDIVAKKHVFKFLYLVNLLRPCQKCQKKKNLQFAISSDLSSQGVLNHFCSYKLP